MTTPPTDRETTIAPATDPRFDVPAVLCGVCSETLSARTYLDGDDACPACGAAFNPGCRAHRDRYFGTGDDAK
ncbi:hypothetical protein DQW50_15015 [Halorubrum sp. 48-1-W]|uniref:hypothetical protein n=1 Tax=Halorubrum sp. 48-1-W TaxID=2249761 RepID=UPI000DCC8F86|nr:hypothetical protein [Halorubrum sp. 48-1-W]RAW44302.1 hypothetical protein DQW50_15015 [Halorubrum sp. 48-1-W]